MAGGAKPPKITKNVYTLDGSETRQVKIATSNLFIDTGDVPVDYMTGAIFDGIGGNEFINGGSSDIILQDGNTIILNAGQIRYEIDTKKNERQPDGTDTFFSQFAISLNSYLPTINASPTELLGTSAPIDFDNPVVIAVDFQFVEKNVYFDEEYKNICIELTNLPVGEQVEVEFITSYNSLDSGII